MMANVMYSKEILEAISHLRARKARPDASRITMYLLKKYGLSNEVVKAAIAICVKESLVFKVEYKGYISYRDASKSNHGRKHAFRSNLITSLLRVFGKLAENSLEIQTNGLPLEEFKKALLCPNVLKTDESCDDILDIAITNGIFTILPNKNIIATKYLNKFSKQRNGVVDNTNTDNTQTEITSSEDPMHEDDDECTFNAEHSIDSCPTECTVCRETIITHNKNIISCKSCSNICHLKCACNTSFYKYNQMWKCADCTVCAVCKIIESTNSLVICVKCNSAYHKQCHSPKLQDSITGMSFWFCNFCEDKNDVNNILAKSVFFCSPGNIPKVRYEPWEHKAIWSNFKPRIYGSISHEEIDEVIPDITDWTCDRLYNYLKNQHPQGAYALKERTINGRHLLKMSRVEVIQGLGLKLGPALKLYKEVVILQRRRNDSKLYYL